MYMRKTEEKRCPFCDSELLYGVKEEPDVWKVFFECTDVGCGREYRGEGIPRSIVDNVDEVYERAKKATIQTRRS